MITLHDINTARIKELGLSSYTSADIEKLEVMLAADLARQAVENETIYLNSEWGAASTAVSDRIELALTLLKLGCKEVQPHQLGVQIGNAIIALKKQRWYSMSAKKWYFYKSLEQVIEMATSAKPVNIKELMERKQKEQPDNSFWKDEDAVTAWLAKKKAV